VGHPARVSGRCGITPARRLPLVRPSYGLFMGSIIVDDDVLAVVAPLIIFPIMLFSGLTAVNIPIVLSWIEYVIYLRYAVLAIFVTEMQGKFSRTCTAATTPSQK
jgi:hypothetical protein